MMDKNIISQFRGEYAFLSNFYTSPFSVGHINYPTVEHYFQANKAGLLTDEHLKIARAATPTIAKRMGRRVALPPNWMAIRDHIMFTGLLCKFTQNPVIARKLVRTSPAALIHANTWHDNYWGVCTCDKCKHIKGQDKLGSMLMTIRQTLEFHGF